MLPNWLSLTVNLDVDIIQEVPIEVTLYALFAISYSTYGN